MNPYRIFNPCAGSSNALFGCWGSCWALQRHIPHDGNTRSTVGRTVTLYEFNALDPNARGTYLWAHGEFIANGGDEIGPFVFYRLHDYFVEVVFDLEFNTIVSLVPFKTGPRYERMVHWIDLSRLADQ